MRPELLELLRCPRCGGGLELDAAESDAHEVRRGRLDCACGARYAVHDGIAELTLSPAERDDEPPDELADPRDTLDEVTGDAMLINYEAVNRAMSPRRAGRALFGTVRSWDQAVERLALGPGVRVLDVGAGATWTTARLAAEGAWAVAADHRSARYVGLGSADVLFEAGSAHFERVLTPIERLPFRDAGFDRVVCQASLHDVADLSACLAEAARVLKPGGRLILVNEPVASLRGWFDGTAARRAWARGAPRRGVADYRSALRRAGLGTRLVLPAGLEARLGALAEAPGVLRASTPGQRIKYRVIEKLASSYGRSPAFRKLAAWLYAPALGLFGQLLFMEADKPGPRP